MDNQEFDELSNTFVSEPNMLEKYPEYNDFKIDTLSELIEKVFESQTAKNFRFSAKCKKRGLYNYDAFYISCGDPECYWCTKLDEKLKETISDVLRPDNCCGDSEYGPCDYCGSLANVHRKYWHYPIKCDCHGPTHFEMVRYCTGCEDKVTEPKQTMVCTHHEDGSQWNILMPTSILIKSEE